MASPQTSDVSNPQPIWQVNAKWVNGVAPGYWPTAGAGLTLKLSAGTAFSGGAIVNYAGGTLALANNTTNYVYLDPNAGCAPASNTTGFTSAVIPIAVVVTAAGAITSITDNRTWFVAPAQGTFAVVSAIAGQPSASQLVCIYTAFGTEAFPANFGSPNQSYGSVGSNPTATATYTVNKNGSSVGSIAISTGGVFTFTTAGFTLNAGDRLTIIAPSSHDATLADVGITLVGTR